MRELARRYAEACYGLCPETEHFDAAARFLLDSTPLREALENPAVDWREKEKVLSRLPLWDSAPQLLNFFRLLVKKSRMALLPEIAEAYRSLDREARNTAVCRMRCARVPDEARQEQLKAALCRLHHRDEVLLEITVDPDLLGGFVLNIDGVTYDRSVRGRLQDMARQLQERRLI